MHSLEVFAAIIHLDPLSENMVVSYFVFDAQIRQTSFSRKIRFYCRRFCFLTVHTVLPAFCQPLHTFCFISLQPSSDCTCSYSCLSAGCFLTDFPFCNLLNNCYSLFCCSFFPFGHNFTPSMFDSAFIISLSPIEGAYHCGTPAIIFDLFSALLSGKRSVRSVHRECAAVRPAALCPS